VCLLQLHFLEQNALFLFGLDKRIDGKKSSIENFFSKVSQELDKDNNTHILQQQVCHLNDGSDNFFVDCATPERKNAFVDKVIEELTVYYNELKDNPNVITL
jgi:hypothetical protein